MNNVDQRAAAKQFAEDWKGRGDEKSDTQSFWIALLEDVFGIRNTYSYVRFEDRVQLGHKSFIDVRIPTTRVLIEQKTIGKDLNKKIRQSDGTELTPFEQACRYNNELPFSEKARWIITCNFAEFYVYDMDKIEKEPQIIKLEDLPNEYYRLNFLVDENDENIKREMELSFQAGNIVGKIYDALYKQYKNPEDKHSQQSLNKLCVRLVFCLYAEDADIFGRRLIFRDYIRDFSADKLRWALIELFKVLDTPEEERDPYLEEPLAEFPYVNGGLFKDEDIEIPRFTEEIKEILVHEASEEFDWSGISPTIFGAVFESTLNPETRRKGGMHYTSLENIHKVIDPLFLNDLRAELTAIEERTQVNVRHDKLIEFTEKLGKLKFLEIIPQNLIQFNAA